METGPLLATADEFDKQCWSYAPDSILLQVFGYLNSRDILKSGLVCRSWWRISRDEIIWKHLFFRDYHISRSIPIMPGAVGWMDEYRRLHCDVPVVLTQSIDAHAHQVLHVSFSHNGTMFATTSKDGNVMVWNSTYPCTLKYQQDMKEFRWKYTQFTQFNCSDTLLLVSGIHFGSPHSTSGEIAVFTLQNEFLLQCRVVNKPYDVFGCWIGEHHLISGELHWLAHLTSSSTLWVNKASQEPDSEHTPIITPLYNFYNPNASSVRSVLIGECKWTEEVEETERVTQVVTYLTPTQQVDPHPSNQLTLVYKPEYRDNQRLAWESHETSSESDSGSWSGSSQEDDLRNKLLIFTTGADTYTPHQIGFKRIDKVEFPRRLSPGPSIKERIAARDREREREREGDGDQPDWADFNAVREKFNVPDKIIDLHGHIIGMALSPDNRYLYVNSRPWPVGYSIENPLSPPPIASRIDIHVIDLTNLKPVGYMLRSHQAYTANSDCFFIFLDISEKFIASGAEDSVAYIWDRHYGVCLTLLPHTDCVNAIAFNPADPHMCVTASDDYSIKVWRSRTSTAKLGIGGRGQTIGVDFRSGRD